MTHPFMEEALKAAIIAGEKGDVPIGAVLVHNNQIIASSGNRVYQHCDPTAHAEIEVLRQGALHLKTTFLSDCDLYVTLEPCAMCAQAIAWSRIRRLYFGAYDPKGGAVIHGAQIFEQPTCHHRPEVIGGIQEDSCGSILKNYFEQKRF